MNLRVECIHIVLIVLLQGSEVAPALHPVSQSLLSP